MATEDINFVLHTPMVLHLDNTTVDADAFKATTDEIPNPQGDAPIFRRKVYNDVFPVDAVSYTDATDKTTFTISIGTIDVPNELIAAVGKDNATIQSELDTISAWAIAQYPPA